MRSGSGLPKWVKLTVSPQGIHGVICLFPPIVILKISCPCLAVVSGLS